ncbi:hypothetical protein V6N12_042296 [Hibiscus sabdariffa]|uniref:Uncharacterized protein n=1 Tax=Hibiscus sabdariffa TaxID=183260 RepID=A0ABR2EED2_9ROSI
MSWILTPNIHSIEGMVLSIQSMIKRGKREPIFFEKPWATVQDFVALGFVFKMNPEKVGANRGDRDELILLPNVSVGTDEQLIINIFSCE